jgi:hypothetical protein
MLTLLACGQSQNGTYVELMLQAYKLRVYAEAGVFEAEECLRASLKGLDSIQFTPIAGILRNYLGAAVGYSLRNLDARTTNVVRIRRSNDNAESNFTAAQILNGELLSFCGGNNGFVTAWYDQSGYNAHVTQTTATNQPFLVLNGAVNLQNGKPAISFDGVNDFLSFSGEVLNKGSFVAFSVNKNNKTGGVGRIFDQSLNNGGALLYSNVVGDEVFGLTSVGSLSINLAPIKTDYALQTGQMSGGKSKIRRNGVELLLNTTPFTMSGNTGIPFTVGENSPANPSFNQAFGGNMQELIIYTTDNDANIIGIETEINNFYNIY